MFHLFGGVLVPFFTNWGGINFTQIMLIQSWYLVWSFILEIPTGAVADYLGRKQSLFLGGLVGVIAVLVYSSTPSLTIFLLAEFLFAVSIALISGADQAFLYDSLKASKQEHKIKQTLGRFESFGLIALMVSAPIGSFIGGSIGPRFAMMFTAIPWFIAFLVGLTLVEPPKGESRETTRYLDIVKDSFKIIKGRRKIQWIGLDLAVVYSLSFLMIWLYQPLMQNLGVNIKWFGLIAAAYSGAQILVMNIFPKIEKRLNLGKLLALTTILPGIFFIIAGTSKSLPLVIVSIILVLGLGLTRKPLITEELNMLIPSAQRATILSALTIIRRIFSAVLSPLVGNLVDWSLNSTFVIIGLTLILFSGFRHIVLANHSTFKDSP